MTARADDLTRNQERALRALASGASLRGAAAAARVSDRTLRRWRHDPCFLQKVRKAQSGVVALATGELCAASLDAVQVLRDIATDEAAPAGVRVTAARCVMELVIRSREIDELEGRIDFLEHQVAARAEIGP